MGWRKHTWDRERCCEGMEETYLEQREILSGDGGSIPGTERDAVGDGGSIPGTERDAVRGWRKHTWDRERCCEGMEEAYLGQREML